MRRVIKKWYALLLVCLFIHPVAYSQMVLTLEKALDISSVNSPDVKVSLMNLQRYEENLKAQRASLKAQLSLTMNPIEYSQNRSFDTRTTEWYTSESLGSNGTFSIRQPIIWTDATISLNNRLGWQKSNSTSSGFSNEAFSNDLYLSITQPLFKANETKMNLRSIELSYENAKISYALQRLNVEKNITNQFYSLYNSQNNLEISRSELKDAEANYTVIKDKVDADMATKDELYQAELNLATAKSSVENRMVSLENSKDEFKKALGIDLAEDITVLAEIDANPVQIDLNKAIQNALGSRLELRQREIEYEEMEQSLKQTKSNTNSFNGSVSASLGITGDNESLGNIYDNPTRNPRVSVSFNIPIFDWGERRARIKAQKINMESHQYQTQEELKDIEINIRKTYRSLENLLNQIDIAKQSEVNAQLTYDLNAERYRNGELTGMDMNQFQSQLSNKKIAYTGALIDYKMELLNLKILTLYDFEKNEPIVPLSILDKERREK